MTTTLLHPSWLRPFAKPVLMVTALMLMLALILALALASILWRSTVPSAHAADPFASEKACEKETGS